MATGREALWASGHDESVEVNQRALIDKVLARYSGEFTVFRELLQNSDDAQSNAVEIHFSTQQYLDHKASNIPWNNDAPLPNLKTAMVHQWTFKNNGMIFRDEDWNRLKKIAEGNPDEDKIGAFGVGFYSLFSVTEEPFVTSGGQWVGFYWKDKKDQLFARRGRIPDANPDNNTWTCFDMPLREAAPIPIAFDLTRFLASSITFMAHLAEVSVYFDDKRLTKLSKSTGISRELGVPKGLQKSSRLGYMSVRGVQSRPLHIKAEVMKWVYSSGSEKPPPPSASQTPAKPPSNFLTSWFASIAGANTPAPSSPAPIMTHVQEILDPLTVTKTSVTLAIYSADVDVRLDKKIAVELHRSTKKNPPSRLKYELIYTAKDEYDASKKEDEEQPFATGSIFQGLRADLDGAGSARVFIGHATGQTTGLGGHMAARFIPTVERESIDLMDRNVAIWNRELLFVGGFLARSAYELELENISQLWEGATSSEELLSWLTAKTVHTLKFFTFHQSTPSPEVSSLLEASFFSCGVNDQFRLLSTKGVKSVAQIRMPDPMFAAFLKELPVVPPEILNSARPMVIALQHRNLIKAITFEDVIRELKARPLSEQEVVACLSWWLSLHKQGANAHLHAIRTELLNAAVLSIGKPGDKDERIIPLSIIKTLINPRGLGAHIPLDGPLPDHLLPPTISKPFQVDQLLDAMPWSELTILGWLQHICGPSVASGKVDYQIDVSAPWAEKVLGVIIRAWPSLSNEVKGEVVNLLKQRSCIPTSGGLKRPEDAYFINANIFNDLPVVTFPSGLAVKGITEKVLVALGVRKHVELQLIFNRMIKTNEWTIADLIKYLVAVRNTLTSEEWSRLKLTSAFSKETSPGELSDGQKKPPRFQASQLYEPLPVFRDLGLPVIDWGTQHKWRATSEEAKFLFDLGLMRFPPLKVLVGLCASPDDNIRGLALKYLVDNLDIKYPNWDPMSFADVAFIPAIKDGKGCLGNPKEVFSTTHWGALGFMITSPNVTPQMVTKLKIKQHPPTSRLVALLETSKPKDETQAKQWFSILATQVSSFTSSEIAKLGQIPMVPARSSEGKSQLKWLAPTHCYFVGTEKTNVHSKLFVFVDFGAGNTFLRECGTKDQPGVEEIAQMLLSDPHKFYELAEGPSNYFNELRNIAVNSRAISSGTLTRMKRSPILLGSQRKVAPKNEKNIPDMEDEEWDLQYDLKKPDEIIIADDTIAHQFFGDSIFAAPQEDILEAFYAQLGSRRLSSLIKEEYKTSVEVKDAKAASDIRQLILERLPLFLHEHTHAKTRVSYSWLISSGNFVVKAFGKLGVTKSLYFGSLKLEKTQEASAVAKRVAYGPIQLWLANNAQVDMYEVATSLNRLLFESPKTNDALLFMTILSTDLKALKRRGYNVDRILRQQNAQRQAALEAAQKQRDEQTKALMSAPEKANNGPPPVLPPKPEANAPPILPIASRAKAASVFQNMKKKLGVGEPSSASHPDPGVSIPPTVVSNPTQPPPPAVPSKPGITPLKNIEHNISQAIAACRPESHNLLHNRQQMSTVKESLNEGYCDVSGRVGDLTYVGSVRGVKVYVTGDVAAPHEFVQKKEAAIGRFVQVIEVLTGVYALPKESLHVFYDTGGGLIAFNRNASVFFNLRYWEAWHDETARTGDLGAGLVSWYFTLAHEIAHNLVQPHNSEHEFYFSALCEQHLTGLGRVLGNLGYFRGPNID